MMASTIDNLYVTYVDIDRELIKVWGQRNRLGATYIERQMMQLHPQFNRAHIPNPSEIRKGMFCFAKYTDDNYYRARVISSVQNDSVSVLFVDYGNRDIIKLSNIRIQYGNEGDVLTKMCEQAEEYYLARVGAPAIGWTKEIVSEIRRDICYDDFYCQIIAQVGDQKILDIQFHNEDFSNYLVKKQLARPLSLPVQRQMILSYCSLVPKDLKPEPAFPDIQNMTFSPSMPHPVLRASFTPSHDNSIASNYGKPKNLVSGLQPSSGLQYSTPQHVNSGFQHIIQDIPKNLYFPSNNSSSGTLPLSSHSQQPSSSALNTMSHNQFDPIQLDNKNPKALSSCESNIIQLLAQQVKQYIAKDSTKSSNEDENNPHHYVNTVLEVGNTYNVITSYVDDGPWSFSIQLMASETELQQLMDELSSTELVPIKTPVVLGHPCIASSALYKNLCRGVVVSISHSALKVYFVDFGNTEDLPASSIYELPPKFFKIKVLSQKFSLSGLQKVAYSDDIRKFFKEVVQDELLMLRVTSLEEDNLPTCELYLKNSNIKRILNEKIRLQRTCAENNFPKVGDIENVIVTWVVSPQKFFIQLQKRDTELKLLKEELAEVEKNGQRLTYQQLSVGFKCICRYELDGNWYRVVITSVDSENEITVFYVDYGNTETVNISLLRRVHSSSLINQMHNQAIQCSLKGFENKPFNKEFAGKLEALVLEKEFQMTIVSSEKELLCVQLFQNGLNISELLAGKDTIKLDSFDTSSSREDVRSSTSGGSSVLNSYEKDKFPDLSVPLPKQEGRVFGGDKTRVDEKENWREGREKENHWGEKSGNQHTWKPRTFKPGREKFDRDFSVQGKPGGSKGAKQEKVREDWDDHTKSDRSRGFKQEKPRDGWDNKRDTFGDRKKPEENRRSGEGKRFDRSKSRGLWKGGEEPKSKVEQNMTSEKAQSFRKTIPKEEIAPPGSNYEERVISIGSCENGIVTYYFSPDEFYVQLLAQEKEFTKMMKDIQIYYSDKYSIRDPSKAGDIVIAQFSVDKVLYRAEVIKPSPVTVRYVDYGNHEPVCSKLTWPVHKNYLKLPKQVIKCRLSNIRPTDLYWPAPGSEVDKFFGLSEYRCKFIGVEGDMYEIAMEDVPNGKDVAQEIIAAGLGRSSAPELDVPEIAFSLLPKQVLRLFVSHVESSSKFFVILNPKGLELIENEVKTFCEDKKNLIKLNETFIKPETACLCTIDYISWYRGNIVEINGNKILVWLMDKGNCVEVTADKLAKLPDRLKGIQAQAIECFLHGSCNIRSEEEFKREIESRENLIHIASATNERLAVVLYDADGQKYEFQNCDDFPENVDPISHLPIISSKVSVVVSHYENPHDIYVHLLEDWEKLENFSYSISNFYSEEQEDFELVTEAEGTLVAANSLVYETWYRARIVSATENKYEVFYIDYGNKEVLPRNRVKKLDRSFISLHAFCVKTGLNIAFKEEKVDEITSSLLEFCGKKEVLSYIENKDGNLLLEPVVEGEKFSQLLEKMGLLSSKEDEYGTALGEESLPEDQPVPDSEQVSSNYLNVLISHIDSPEKFWVHKESEVNNLQQFQEKLQKESESLHSKENPAVGDIVAASYNSMWFRGKVIKVKDKNLKVQFIDYGNTVYVDLAPNRVKELTEEFANVPAFANPFALKGNWKEKGKTKFEEIVLQNDDFIKAVVLKKSDPTVVDLFQNGQSIAEMMIKEGYGFEEDDSSFSTVYISYFHSPDDFYIQKHVHIDIYRKITERLSDPSVFSDAVSIKEGEMYIAKFEEDDAWYRVKINHIFGDGGIEAYFVDFGNKANVTEVKYIPDDLSDIPYLAENCSLVYGEKCDTWSEAACKRFGEFSDGRQLRMKVVGRKSGRNIVELFEGSSSVTSMIERLCERDQRVDVFVSYAVSPTDFYIQFTDDESYDLICEKLEEDNEREELNEKSIGTLCQARYYEDGRWYRARILRNLEDGCEVFFIDFGNVSCATEVKKIPPEIEDIPPRAMRCTLDLPETNIPENVKEEFINLAAGGATVYRARIILPGKVNVVSLKLNGMLLEETFNVDVNPEECDGSNIDVETDDGKNSKNLISSNYLMSNRSKESGNGENFVNETDEEKRKKIVQFDGTEGFKSDDQKSNGGTPTSGFYKATDDDFFLEVWDTEGETPEVDADGSENNPLEVLDVSDVAEEVDDEETENVINGLSDNLQNVVGITEDEENWDNDISDSGKDDVGNTVSDSVSLEQEKLGGSSVVTKTAHSENLLPGSISRGVSLESMPNNQPSEQSEESSGVRITQSAPNSPKLERRKDGHGCVKIDPSDRVVPGHISTGAIIETSLASEKISKNNKILPGAVNGSSEEI